MFRSNKHIYAQVIDDVAGVTLASASTMEKSFGGTTATVDAAKGSASSWASAPRPPGSKPWCSTAAGYRYHGRVAGVADGAREAGLEL